MPRQSPILAVACTSFLIACADAGGSDTGVLVRDSAGVTIVENHAPAWREGEAWTVAPDPELHIGMVEGAPEYQLDRIAGAIRQPDGRIVVANGASNEIRVYTADGTFDRALGREGGGPGEFRALSWIGVGRGDSIVAYDWRERRITVFAPTGELARTATVAADSAPGPPPRIVGRLGDGSFIAQIATTPPLGELGGGLVRSPAAVGRIGPAGERLGRIGELRGEERLVSIDRERNSISMLILPVFRSSRVAVADGSIHVADTDRFEVRRHDPDGRLTGVVRGQGEAVPVTPADVERLTADRASRAGSEAERRISERFTRTMELPDTMPAFADMLADDEGNLWIQEFRWPDGGGPRWSVYTPAGRWLGDLDMPDGLKPTHIADGHVTGVWRDDLDVQHVRVHRILGS